MRIPLTPDLAGALVALLPAAARAPGSGVVYADDVLTVPDAFAAAADAAMAAPGWADAGARTALAPVIRAECQRRIVAVASLATQINLSSAAAAGIMPTADRTIYAALLAWVWSMRDVSAAMVRDGDSNFAADGKWPPLPAGGAELVARY